MDKINAHKLLPHGKEFTFIDEVTHLSSDQATAIYKIKGDEHFLKAHFPGEPIMPAVLLIEAIAQLGGIILNINSGNLAEKSKPQNIRLTAVKNAKVLGAALPNQILKINASLTKKLGNLALINGSINIVDKNLTTKSMDSEKLIAKADICLSFD